MLDFDEDALICDLAETYGIHDYTQLPLMRVAVFAMGLRDNSRIKMKMSGQSTSIENLLLAKIADNSQLLLWSKTKDAQHNRNRPKAILDGLLQRDAKANNVVVHDSSEEYEKARQALLEGGQPNGN